MTTLGEKLRAALDKKIEHEVVKQTIEAWDNHEDQIRKPQQEKQMANLNPVVVHATDKPHFGVSNNVMRETFNIVKYAPNFLPKTYIDMLVKRGFKESSVTAVIYQLVRAGQLVRNDKGLLTAAQDEYTPIKQAKRKKPEPVPESVTQVKQARKIVLIKRRKTEGTEQGIAALKADGGQPVSSLQDLLGAPKARGFHPSAIVDNLSVLHARELYDYLKKIFTGESK